MAIYADRTNCDLTTNRTTPVPISETDTRQSSQDQLSFARQLATQAQQAILSTFPNSFPAFSRTATILYNQSGNSWCKADIKHIIAIPDELTRLPEDQLYSALGKLPIEDLSRILTTCFHYWIRKKTYAPSANESLTKEETQCVKLFEICLKAEKIGEIEINKVISLFNRDWWLIPTADERQLQKIALQNSSKQTKPNIDLIFVEDTQATILRITHPGSLPTHTESSPLIQLESPSANEEFFYINISEGDFNIKIHDHLLCKVSAGCVTAGSMLLCLAAFFTQAFPNINYSHNDCCLKFNATSCKIRFCCSNLTSNDSATSACEEHSINIPEFLVSILIIAGACIAVARKIKSSIRHTHMPQTILAKISDLWNSSQITQSQKNLSSVEDSLTSEARKE